jgi:hypothetical protein
MSMHRFQDIITISVVNQLGDLVSPPTYYLEIFKFVLLILISESNFGTVRKNVVVR